MSDLSFNVKILADRKIDIRQRKFAGTQGDYKSCTITFDVSEIYSPDTKFQIEWFGCADTYALSILLDVDSNKTVSAEVPQEILDVGGTATVYLNEVKVENGKVTQIICSYPLRLYLGNKATGNNSVAVGEYNRNVTDMYLAVVNAKQDVANYVKSFEETKQGLDDLVKNAEQIKSDIQEDVASAETSATNAKKTLDEFEEKLKNGEYKGDEGETGPQGPQGIQGPKGDKGDPGDTPDLSGYVTKATFDSLHLTDRIIPVGLPVKDTVAKTLTFQNFYLNGIYYRVQNPVVNYSEMGNKISVVVKLEDLSEQIGNATLSFYEDYSNDEILDLVENGSTSVYGYYRYIPAGSGYAEDMFSYYFSANPIFTYGLGDFEARLKEKIDGEYAKLTDLELHDLPRNIRIASYDGTNTVKVVFDCKNTSCTMEFEIITGVDVIGKAYLNKFKISDGNYGYLPTFNDETDSMSIHKTFAFDYIVENGKVVYLSTDGVNYLLEKQIESALDEIIEIQEDLLVPNGDEVSY